MSRCILDEAQIHPEARAKVARHGADIVKEVQDAVAGNEIVIVGMRQNPFPKKARKLLDEAGLGYKYLEYGSYFGGWVLVGGASELERLLESRELKRGK